MKNFKPYEDDVAWIRNLTFVALLNEKTLLKIKFMKLR